MRLLIALQHRCLRAADGTVWTRTMFPYAYWQRYLVVFDQVRILTRIQDADEIPQDWVRFDGDGVTVLPIPAYVGPWQYLWCAREVGRAAEQAVHLHDAVILRVPSHSIASYVARALRQVGHPYAVEVVADPYHLFAPGCVKNPLRPYLRWALTRQQQRQCAEACAALYVTQSSLQDIYPCSGYVAGVSDVELTDEHFAPAPRAPGSSQFTLLSIGTMQEVYKGFDVLIDAVARCVRQGLDLRLVLIGDGKYRPALRAQAARAGLVERVEFTGELTLGTTVRRHLDQADLFVLPSRSEGLPRVLLEAMARALPCLGSNVGGIPELLAPEDLAPAGNPNALARAIQTALTDPARLVKMSARNWQKAHDYHDTNLHDRRITFFRHVRDQTTAWIRANALSDGIPAMPVVE